MLEGVTIVDPNHTYIEADVEIGRDTTILPGTVLRGNTVIGENCIMGPNADIRDCRIADGVTVEHSTLRESRVGSQSTVGPYAYVRPNSSIGERVKIGDFVEVKNADIGTGTKVSHLSYIGDADLGESVNVGCGAVTVNYDGERKWRTVVGNRSFIGCNANLIAPVHIGRDTYIAAGWTITDDIPNDAFADCPGATDDKARVRQKIKG